MWDVVDLSQSLSPRTPRSSDHPEVRFDTIRWFSRHGIQTRQVTASLHSGTHIDAPALYVQGGMTVDQVPVSDMVGPGVILDMKRDEWGEISASDLAAATPSIEERDIVVLNTGWQRHYFTNEETYVLKSPGLTKDGVDFLVEKKIKLLCYTGPSSEHIFMRLPQWKSLRPDIFDGIEADDGRFPPAYAHKAMFAAGVCHVDNVGGDIDLVTGVRCMIAALAAKYEGVEAAPVRIVALVDRSGAGV